MEEGQRWGGGQRALLEGEEEELEVAKPNKVEDGKGTEVEGGKVEREDGEEIKDGKERE